MKQTIAVAAILAAATVAHAEPVSGWYGGILLVVDDGRLSGVVSDMARDHATDHAPHFMCRTLVGGRVDGVGAQVEAWLPDDPARIPGTLRMEGPDVRVRLDENPPGCAMVSNMIGEGQRWRLEEARPDWIGVGLVTAERTVLHRSPAEEAGRERPYLVEWDAVAVLERREDWVHVEYVESDTPARGWVKPSDLALAFPGDE